MLKQSKDIVCGVGTGVFIGIICLSLIAFGVHIERKRQSLSVFFQVESTPEVGTEVTSGEDSLTPITEKELIQTPQIKSLGTYKVTAYCPCEKCCWPYADGKTSTGIKVKPGMKIVAAPPSFPDHTLLFIDGYANEWVSVEDRGGAIKGKKLDVFFYTHQEALNWGVKNIEVFQWVGK